MELHSIVTGIKYGRGSGDAWRDILAFCGESMQMRANRELPQAPATKRWSRSRAQRMCPRRHLRVLPIRTRPRAVPEFMCPFQSRERWHFLKEKANRRRCFLGAATLEPL
jgi:hypothetical protein